MKKIQDTKTMSFNSRKLYVTGASFLAIMAASIPAAIQAQGNDAKADTANIEDSYAIRFRADTLVVTPVLRIGLVGAERTAVVGSKAEFQSYNNYPAFIERGEVRIFRTSQSPAWGVPAETPEALYFVYRVYAKDGKYDETNAKELTILQKPLEGGAQATPREEYGQIDEAAHRNIALNGLMATVTGKADPVKETVRVSGRTIPIDKNGIFVAQHIVPRDNAGMVVVIERDGRVVKSV
jgi:hypothetical protein